MLAIYSYINSMIIVFMESLDSLIKLLMRLWIVNSFYPSGILKFKAFSSTVDLFRYEYNVLAIPLPPPIVTHLSENFSITIPKGDPVLAAYVGTGFEIILPIFLLFGFMGRLPILMMAGFNYVALVSYPFLWGQAGAGGFYQHIAWGVALMVLLMYGNGNYSLDYLIRKRKPLYDIH